MNKTIMMMSAILMSSSYIHAYDNDNNSPQKYNPSDPSGTRTGNDSRIQRDELTPFKLPDSSPAVDQQAPAATTAPETTQRRTVK